MFIGLPNQQRLASIHFSITRLCCKMVFEIDFQKITNAECSHSRTKRKDVVYTHPAEKYFSMKTVTYFMCSKLTLNVNF